jgi:drug/metabolite transporter (DMT)-like permease
LSIAHNPGVTTVGSALAAAALWGAADFLGGFTSRRINPFLTVLISRAGGFLVLLPLMLAHPVSPDRNLVAWGALAGLAGVLSLMVFFQALAEGTMAIVAPISGVVSAVLPAAVGLALGERPGAWADAGIVLGIGSIWLVGWAEGGPSDRHGANPLTLAILAGGLAGLFLIFMSRSGGHRGAEIPMIFIYWTTSTPVVLAIMMLRRVSWRASPGPIGIALVVGMVYVLGGLMYLVATQSGGLTIPSVLASLYPAATVVLSLSLLRERIRHRQLVGAGLALAAVAMIAAG